MNGFSQTSLRFRLMLLVGLALMPLAGLQLHDTFRERDHKLVELKEDVRHTAELSAGNIGQQVAGTRALLTSLTNAHFELLSPSAVNARLKEVLGRNSLYSNVGILSEDGRAWASALRPARAVSYTNAPWFRKLQQTREFTLSECAVDDTLQRDVIIFALPLAQAPSKPSAAVFATLPVESLARVIGRSHLPPDAVIKVVDRSGVELVRKPEAPGHTRQRSDAWLAVRPRDNVQTAPLEMAGPDGISRFFYFCAVPESSQGLWVEVGFSQAALQAQTRLSLILSVAGMVLLLGAVLAFAWHVNNIWILRPMGSLTAASRRLAEGDLSARAHAAGSPAEFDVLAQTFDQMAASLQKHQEELRRTQFAVDCAPEPILWAAPNGHFVYANQAAVDKLGYPLKQLLGMSAYDVCMAVTSANWPEHWEKLKQEHTFIFESQCRTRSGPLLPIEVTSNYLKFGELEYICAFLHDITHRKLAEENLRNLNAELELRVKARTAALEATNASLVAEINERQRIEASLHENQRTLATLMSNLPGMTYRCRNDPDWTMEFLSEGAMELTGYPASALIANKIISYAKLIHGDDRAAGLGEGSTRGGPPRTLPAGLPDRLRRWPGKMGFRARPGHLRPRRKTRGPGRVHP